MAQCSSNKIGYATHEMAMMAMYKIQTNAKAGKSVPIRVYFCHECERFHITSQVKNSLAEKQHGVRDFLWFLHQLISTRA